MMKIKQFVFASSMAVTAMLCGNVAAADGKALYSAKLCQTCHGAEGKSPIMPLYPKVNGQSKEYLLAQMKDIKTGKRSNGMSAAMKAMVANVSDAELEAIAAYLSTVN
ncbi:cytochrome C [Pseudoalteromonas luteoviolacea NCIMB 1944]|uniref:Cytochrome c553 n=3 Tax=Pseudoalteromonas TaxID=53246 RepID=V4JCT9_PSEL2|nr:MULTISPECIES: c-type cytochrome [Pseudoalteromonas]ESP92887.1 cytochrome c553 [Pseudoalteromonas luteoviolacea 2ta16]KZN35699.1 cytochrome C [Pseudoalteromonas luteoviolacea NCIMB 1944]MCG7546349.1 c-type cytochrome [Pseudoalteromonas sp. Of7M-16]MDK2598698.1 c-type cytochrome [Pseudoalteromonas sp. P94(2023)]